MRSDDFTFESSINSDLVFWTENYIELKHKSLNDNTNKVNKMLNLKTEN